MCVWLSHNLASTSLIQQLFAHLLKEKLGSSSAIPSEYRDHYFGFSTEPRSKLQKHPKRTEETLHLVVLYPRNLT
ncbi:hypothetical protein [Shimazuella soli]|uniref:hypothetical protein n=1 Tax=Shimazuella soli TaxID=1892854 RepID=UPI001F0D458D|nr:hypothetical protein [Shimazuella soli]